jgi:hypothetical protein
MNFYHAVTAAVIFVPLSFALAISSSNFNSPINKAIKLNDVEINALNKNDLNSNYFVYLTYQSCVDSILENSSKNRASNYIKTTCNPILDNFNIKHQNIAID